MTDLGYRASRDRKVEALLEGASRNGVVVADYSEGCLKPYTIAARSQTIDGRTDLLDVKVRCRKCRQCLQDRSRLWTARAFDEVAMASRTWFGTLTRRPSAHMRDVSLARRWTRRFRADDFDVYSKSDQLGILVRFANKDITKYFKRLRHVAKFRYLLVCELHKSGLPHWHLLLHEMGTDIPKRVLEEQWPSGFSHWRLVKEHDPNVVFYVCKYLAKDAVARVRASAAYGRARKSAKLAVFEDTARAQREDVKSACPK